MNYTNYPSKAGLKGLLNRQYGFQLHIPINQQCAILTIVKNTVSLARQVLHKAI